MKEYNNSKQIINNDLIDSTVISLDNMIDNIVSDLNSIDMIIYNLNDYCTGNVADEIKNKFTLYRDKFNVISNNLSTYSSDLIKVKNGLEELAQTNIEYLTSLADEKLSQAKEIL